jgi:transcriptional regulator with XRE-family HTH domain
MPGESKDFLRGFASNLRQLIESRSISVGELSDRADISIGQIEAALEAREEFGALEIVRLAAALDATPQAFFAGLDFDDD